MVGLVGWWRRVELEKSREEKNTRRVESKKVIAQEQRKLGHKAKLTFLRKFYPDCSTSPGGKTLNLIHAHKKSELLTHPSDIVKNIRGRELSFSPQAKLKAGGGGFLAEIFSPSKKSKIRDKINFFENGRLGDEEPVLRLPDCTEMETTKVVGKFTDKKAAMDVQSSEGQNCLD